MEESDWKGLHPASVLVNLLPTAYRALRSFWPLALALVIGGSRRNVETLDGVLILLFLVVPIARTIVHWATLRYRVDNGHLVIQTGLLNRQVRTIPPERIQNVELVRNVFHRMSGLVELRVETASGTDVEGMLSALSEAEAEAIVAQLAEARASAPEPTEEVAPPLLTNGVKDLLWFGLSTTRFGLVLVVMGLGYELLLTDVQRAESLWGVLGTSGSVVVFLALVLGAWLAGAVTTLVRHWNYRLSKLGDRLVAEEGLLTRRRVELPLSKVQLVSIREPFLRRMLGFGSVHMETAAAREGGGGTQRAEAVVPVVEAEHLSDVVGHALSGLPRDLHALTYLPPHPRALWRAWVGGTLATTALSVGVSWLFWPYGLVTWLLVPLDALQSWLDHRYQGWWIGERHLVSRTGWWVRSTRVVSLAKLQSVDVMQGPLARRWDLAQLRLRVAGNGVSLPVLAYDEALDLEVRLVKLAVSVDARAEDAPPPLDHDEQAAQEQDPGDRLAHEAHEEQRDEHDALALGVSAVVPDGADDGDQAEDTGAQGGDSERVADGSGLPVEPRLPQRTGSSLHEQQGALEEDESSERDLHTGNEDSQA